MFNQKRFNLLPIKFAAGFPPVVRFIKIKVKRKGMDCFCACGGVIIERSDKIGSSGIFGGYGDSASHRVINPDFIAVVRLMLSDLTVFSASGADITLSS